MSEVNGILLLKIFYSCPFHIIIDIFNLLYHPDAQYSIHTNIEAIAPTSFGTSVPHFLHSTYDLYIIKVGSGSLPCINHI
jgi:hypothetical protein